MEFESMASVVMYQTVTVGCEVSLRVAGCILSCRIAG
jgi:hypothetical protein